jgi:transcriptional regulator with XRE-family HTH domain
MEIQTSVRPHKSPRQRSDIVAAYRRSQLTQREFAARHGIALSTLQRWLHSGTAAVASPAPALIELPNLYAPKPASLGAGYRLLSPGGVILEVNRGFDADEVRVLAHLLREL